MVKSNRPLGTGADLVKSALGSASIAGPRRLTRSEAESAWNTIAGLILKRGPLPTSPAAREARLVAGLADLKKAAAAQSRQEIAAMGEAAARARKAKRKKAKPKKTSKSATSDSAKAAVREALIFRGLEERLRMVEKMPAPGMPSRLARFPGLAATDKKVAALRVEHADLVKRAEAANDVVLARGFQELADDVEKKLDKLGGM